jgi:hypothetical protein
MPTLDSVKIEVLNTLDQISVDPVESTSVIQLEENSTNLVVELSTVDPSSSVRSVNGKTGHVVIDYPDISSSPVNQVKYVHNQTTISNQWNIAHNLGFFPNITILDNANRVVEADIQYVNINNAKIVMNVGISGTAYLT